MKSEADQALKEVIMEYRLRADIMPHILELVKNRTDGEWPKLVSTAQMAHAHAIAMDLPLEKVDEVQMNRMASFQAALSTSLVEMMTALEKDAKVVKGDYLALKEQVDRAESRIAIARQKYRDVAPAFNERLNKIPDKWFNTFMYKFQPLHTLQ